jgi:hypothetical protein
MSKDKVRIKYPCWSVRTIYDHREMSGVSTAGRGIGPGVTDMWTRRVHICNRAIAGGVHRSLSCGLFAGSLEKGCPTETHKRGETSWARQRLVVVGSTFDASRV